MNYSLDEALTIDDCKLLLMCHIICQANTEFFLDELGANECKILAQAHWLQLNANIISILKQVGDINITANSQEYKINVENEEITIHGECKNDVTVRYRAHLMMDLLGLERANLVLLYNGRIDFKKYEKPCILIYPNT